MTGTETYRRIHIEARLTPVLRRPVEVCCEFSDTHAIVQVDGILYGTHNWRVVRTTGGWKPGDVVTAECLATGEVCEFVLED